LPLGTAFDILLEFVVILGLGRDSERPMIDILATFFAFRVEQFVDQSEFWLVM
jgi:hypothetical protein